jgi:hypothetical protein
VTLLRYATTEASTTMKEIVMADELTFKAIEALRELNNRPPGELRHAIGHFNHVTDHSVILNIQGIKMKNHQIAQR